MGQSLLKHHLGAELTGSGEDHLPRLHPEGGGNTLQPRQLAFLVADIPAAVVQLHDTLGHQFNDLRLLIRIGLAAPDGKNHISAHQQASSARASSLSMSWP